VWEAELTKGIERVREFLLSRGINAQVVELDASTKSSQLAAQALGCSVGEIAKSVVFTGDRTVVVTLSGIRRVKLEKLAMIVGSKLRVASAEEVKTFTGYVAGGVPPFPHHEGIAVFPDASLTTYPRVWAAAGEQNDVMQLSVNELVRTIVSAVVDVSS
jgi:prolyl-tRNA editing enzyme YbaK/EbsC (Cys-tRNA(Pro) deacylase)